MADKGTENVKMDEQTLLSQLMDKTTRQRAFTVLVEQYSQKLYWTARHIVGRHEDADDVVQNTFVKAWNKLDDFRGEASVSTWLHRIAVNGALNLIRKEKRYADSEIDVCAAANLFSDEYFDGDEAEQMLRNAMETLPEAQRAVFALKYYEDKPYKEISEILGTSEGGQKANYHHAVEKIKRFLTRK